MCRQARPLLCTGVAAATGALCHFEYTYSKWHIYTRACAPCAGLSQKPAYRLAIQTRACTGVVLHRMPAELSGCVQKREAREEKQQDKLNKLIAEVRPFIAQTRCQAIMQCATRIAGVS